MQEAHESVQHCLHVTKSSPIDLLWSLSWMHVWSWGLNLWPMALALGWPFAWGRMLWTGVCRCWRMHIGSFWAFCNGINAWCPLISVELPQSFLYKLLYKPKHGQELGSGTIRQHDSACVPEKRWNPCFPAWCYRRKLRHLKNSPWSS